MVRTVYCFFFNGASSSLAACLRNLPYKRVELELAPSAEETGDKDYSQKKGRQGTSKTNASVVLATTSHSATAEGVSGGGGRDCLP